MLTDNTSWVSCQILGKISILDLGRTTLTCLYEIGVSGVHSSIEVVPIVLKRNRPNKLLNRNKLLLIVNVYIALVK